MGYGPYIKGRNLKNQSENQKNPTTIQTLGDLIAHGYRMNGHCRRCGVNKEMDLSALVKRLGRDHVYVGNMPLRCTECRSRDVGITIHPPGR